MKISLSVILAGLMTTALVGCAADSSDDVSASEGAATASANGNELEAAKREFAAADAELNAIWPKVREKFKAVDAELEQLQSEYFQIPETKSADLIKKAQIAWSQSHRDEDCKGQTMLEQEEETAAYHQCRAEKTRERTATLKAYLDDSGQFWYGTPKTHDELNKVIEDLAKNDPESHCDGSSTVETNFCLSVAHQTADKELNDIYQNAIGALDRQPNGSRAKEHLRNAQRAWITIRDNDCEALTMQNWGGTGYSGYYAECMAVHTIDRTNELRGGYPNK